jgi:hypothetical protein
VPIDAQGIPTEEIGGLDTRIDILRGEYYSERLLRDLELVDARR